MTRSNQRDRERQPARRAPSREPRRLLLVVCEGRVTEPEYIHGFVQHTRRSGVQVVVAREHGDPRRVVEIAKEHRDRLGRDEVDEVWCVFDRDEHERFDEAVNMGNANGFRLAISNPCFELWLLLHLRESPGPRHRHEVQRILRDLVPGQHKAIHFSIYAPTWAVAAERAEQLDRAATAMDERYRNPSTAMYRLVRSIASS